MTWWIPFVPAPPCSQPRRRGRHRGQGPPPPESRWWVFPSFQNIRFFIECPNFPQLRKTGPPWLFPFSFAGESLQLCFETEGVGAIGPAPPCDRCSKGPISRGVPAVGGGRGIGGGRGAGHGAGRVPPPRKGKGAVAKKSRYEIYRSAAGWKCGASGGGKRTGGGGAIRLFCRSVGIENHYPIDALDVSKQPRRLANAWFFVSVAK